MTLDEAIELAEIRKKLVCSYCEDCWSEDAEIGLRCMYIVRKLCGNNLSDVDIFLEDNDD